MSADVPLPLEIVTDEDAFRAFFGDEGPTPETPRGTAYLWWMAILNRVDYLPALAAMVWDPTAWGDFSEVADIIDGFSMMQFIERPQGHEDSIAYAKFMPGTGHTMRSFGDAEIDHYVCLTLTFCDDRIWRVWGISVDFKPAADDILAGE